MAWTLQQQLIKLSEESGELIQAIGKYILTKKGINNLAYEIGDVELMCEQIRKALKLNKKVAYWKQIKIKRLEKRLKK
jgi:NTP pyrophosphatase (non-canonical NTP hydrolase)